MSEIWKDVVGYEGLYQVSNAGNVRSVDRYGNNSDSSFMIYKGKKIKKSVKPNGYCYVGLYRHNKPKYFTVHRLVAIAFIPNPDKLPEVNHKDENKQNNTAWNLEWSTRKYNNLYGTKNDRAALKNGKPIMQKSKDGEQINIFRSANFAAKSMGICASNICACLKGKTKTCGGFRWEYV